MSISESTLVFPRGKHASRCWLVLRLVVGTFFCGGCDGESRRRRKRKSGEIPLTCPRTSRIGAWPTTSVGHPSTQLGPVVDWPSRGRSLNTQQEYVVVSRGNSRVASARGREVSGIFLSSFPERRVSI